MKNILLTGATSGIGLSIFELLIEQGYKIHILSRNKEKMEALCSHESASYSVCDIKNLQEVTEGINSAVSAMGSIDVLINNSGLGYFDPIANSNLDEWHEMIDVNVKGLLSVTHGSLEELIASKGHVINITSVASHNVFPNNVVYCATKHAVMAFSKGLRMELGDKIRVTSISPGAVNTDFIHKTTNEELLNQYKEYFKTALNPMAIAEQVKWAIEAPNDVLISEIIVRPNRPVK
ncbi:MAG: SDR family oxidoreductase [Bacteroidota bacterium]